MKFPVKVALGVVVGVQLAPVPKAVPVLFQLADVCESADGEMMTSASSEINALRKAKNLVAVAWTQTSARSRKMT